jgi:hypothetical protein
VLFKKNLQTKATETKPKNFLSGVSKRPKFIAIVVACLLLAAVVGVLAYKSSNKSTTTNKTTVKVVVSNTTLQEAGLIIDGQDQPKLKAIVDKIQSNKDFEQDPNALYILTTYYTFASDTENARKYFDKLSAMYQANKPAEELLQKGGDLEAVKKRLELFEAQFKQIRSNFSGFGDSPQ